MRIKRLLKDVIKKQGGTMKAGTLLLFDDGTWATVVYHNLDGYGVAYGVHLLGTDESTWPEPEATIPEAKVAHGNYTRNVPGIKSTSIAF